VQGTTKLHIPNSWDFYLWKIEEVSLALNKIWPICLFNKNNQRDFQTNQKYEFHHWGVSFALRRTKLESKM